MKNRRPRNRHEFLDATKRKLRWVPNTLTLCNSWCGFAAILWTLTVYERTRDIYDIFAISALIILGAMIFDVLDGFAARMLNATSMHGLQMDSLADMVTFGVAPAVLIAIMTHKLQSHQTTGQIFSTYLLCAIYVGCAALRLATYNVHALLEKKDTGKFHGLPSPGAAAAIASMVLAVRGYDGNLSWLSSVLPVYAAVLGVLMISPLPYIHMGKWLLSVRPREPVKLLILLVVVALVALFRENAVFGIITLYVLSGPITGLVNLFKYGRFTVPSKGEVA